MTPDSARILEPKVLLALTAVVLLVHIAVLRGTAVTVSRRQAPSIHTFTTRTVAPDPLTLPPPRPTVVHPATVQRPRHKAPTATPSSPPHASQQATDDGLAAQPPRTAIDTVQSASRPEEIAAPDQPPAETPEPLPALRPPREVAPNVSPDKVPSSMQLKYKVESNKFPFNLNAELRWRQDRENYDARLEVSLFGQGRTQTSRGKITSEGLAPTRFSDKYRSEVAAHFNREQGKVTFSANTPDAPLLAGAQDRLSILVQLAAMIASAPEHYTQAITIAIQTIGPRDADTWLFTVGNAETLTLPGGEQATLKVVRNPRQAFDQKVELWLAPALGYLPARIRITEPSGDYIDQKWLATESPD